MQHNINF